MSSNRPGAQTNQNYQNFAYSNKKPYYLKGLPFWKRYPRASVLAGGIGLTCVFYSAPIYYFFRTPPENEPPENKLWYTERVTGVTNLERLRAYLKEQEEDKQKWREERERRKALKAAAKAEN